MTPTCPNVLVNGTCEDRACIYAHNIFTCEPCEFVFQSPNEYNQHLKTKKHRRRILGQGTCHYCSICEINVANNRGWEQHIQGRLHQRKADSAGVSPVDVAPQPPISTASGTACDLCQVVLPNHIYNEHLNTRNHKSRERYSRYMTALEKSETDKNGVVVEGSFDFGFVEPLVAKVGTEITSTIKASISPNKSVLLEAKLASAEGHCTGVSS